jgi:hypothetical protein
MNEKILINRPGLYNYINKAGTFHFKSVVLRTICKKKKI